MLLFRIIIYGQLDLKIVEETHSRIYTLSISFYFPISFSVTISLFFILLFPLTLSVCLSLPVLPSPLCQIQVLQNIHSLTHSLAHTQTHTTKYTQTYMHTYTNTKDTHTYMYLHIFTHTEMYVYIHRHSCIHIFRHTLTRTQNLCDSHLLSTVASAIRRATSFLPDALARL